jgi:NAD(P)-dependent dehydrogenase (short-subunit alcohol dehydrogenase family)
MSFDLKLANRRALVTGGTKGIGAAIVETLRDAGARVVATARSAPLRPAPAFSLGIQSDDGRDSGPSSRVRLVAPASNVTVPN